MEGPCGNHRRGLFLPMERREKILLEGQQMERAIRRMAHEILEGEGTDNGVALIGIESRGSHLARRIAGCVESLTSSAPLLATIDVTPYRDDRKGAGSRGPDNPPPLPFVLDDKTVVLVDDVIYTGRTIRAALDFMTQMGSPEKILVAVLVDRGDRELPIKADIVGKNVQVARDDRVHVLFRESDGVDQVVVAAAPGGGKRRTDAS